MAWLSHGSPKSVCLLSEVIYEMSLFQETLLGYKLSYDTCQLTAFVEYMNLAGFFICLFFNPGVHVTDSYSISIANLFYCHKYVKFRSTILCDNVHGMTTCSSQKPLQVNISPSCHGFLCPWNFSCTQLNFLIWLVWKFLMITPNWVNTFPLSKCSHICEFIYSSLFCLVSKTKF